MMTDIDSADPTPRRRIHVAHSPDSDDAFMFYGLAEGHIDTGDLEFVHELQGIQKLNERAMRGELEVTAVSIHAYAYLTDRYILLPHGASMALATILSLSSRATQGAPWPNSLQR